MGSWEVVVLDTICSITLMVTVSMVVAVEFLDTQKVAVVDRDLGTVTHPMSLPMAPEGSSRDTRPRSIMDMRVLFPWVLP
jgi:hypothetical protein